MIISNKGKEFYNDVGMIDESFSDIDRVSDAYCTRIFVHARARLRLV